MADGGVTEFGFEDLRDEGESQEEEEPEIDVEDAPVVSTGDDAGAAPELTGTGADVPAAPPASIEPEITPTNPTGLRF